MVDEIMVFSEQLQSVIRQLHVDFTLKGHPISIEDICSPVGLLPALAKRADQSAQLVLGYGLGISLQDEEDTLLGSRVSLDEFTPDSLRLLCLLDVISEIIKMSPNQDQVALDELLYD